MNKKNKKKTKSNKETSDNIVSEMGQSDAKPSQQSSMEEVGGPAMNREKCLKDNIQSVSSTFPFAVRLNGCPESPSIQSSNIRTCCNGSNMDKRGPKRSSPDCSIELNQGSLSSKNLSQCRSSESTNIMLGNSEVSNNCHAVTVSNGFKCNVGASQFAVSKTRHQPHIMVGKENRRQVWQKSQRSVRESQKHEAKGYGERDVSLLQKNYLVKNNSFLSTGLLPSPLITSCRYTNAANFVANRDTKPYARIHGKVMVESSQRAPHEIVPLGADYLHSSPASAHAEQIMPQFTTSTEPVQCGFQPYSGMEIPMMDRVLRRSFHSSADSEPYKRFDQFNEHRLRKDNTSGMNAKKWVCVPTKESRLLETSSSGSICCVNNDDSLLSCKGGDYNHTERIKIKHHTSAVISESQSTRSTACDEMNSVESEVLKSESASEGQNVERSEVREAYVQKSEDNQQLISSLRVIETLSAAYKLQLLSDSVELINSCPLAEFERFLCAAIPVVASSYTYQNCSVCLHDRLFSCVLCKHQIPSTSLCSLWKWYEEHGNYGLKVKTGDSQNLKGLLTESISSHAHFVPYLSVVQLFGYSHLSNSHGTSEEHSNPKILYKEEDHSESFLSSPFFSSDFELLFQFLESRLPSLRKPLYNKIVDLINDGTSNDDRVLGDPSKLGNMNLCDLHPASWFSVAWYPIYQIPERKFRASFLTYHSLGHLVQRHVPTGSFNKKEFCVVSPVVGMQSYNTKGECWFELNNPIESSLKESQLINKSKILGEQLRRLENNALLFARCIYKDDNGQVNCLLDHEFFSSRKC